MTRGDIVIAAARGQLTRKPRPYVVVQDNRMLEGAATVTLCPITSDRLNIGRIRVAIQASESTGLGADSEVEIDRITTIRRSAIDDVIGRASKPVMQRVDHSLRQWLAL